MTDRKQRAAMGWKQKKGKYKRQLCLKDAIRLNVYVRVTQGAHLGS